MRHHFRKIKFRRVCKAFYSKALAVKSDGRAFHFLDELYIMSGNVMLYAWGDGQLDEHLEETLEESSALSKGYKYLTKASHQLCITHLMGLNGMANCPCKSDA